MHTVQRSARELSFLYSAGDLMVNTRETLLRHEGALKFFDTVNIRCLLMFNKLYWSLIVFFDGLYKSDARLIIENLIRDLTARLA